MKLKNDLFQIIFGLSLSVALFNPSLIRICFEFDPSLIEGYPLVYNGLAKGHKMYQNWTICLVETGLF